MEVGVATRSGSGVQGQRHTLVPVLPAGGDFFFATATKHQANEQAAKVTVWVQTHGMSVELDLLEEYLAGVEQGMDGNRHPDGAAEFVGNGEDQGEKDERDQRGDVEVDQAEE